MSWDTARRRAAILDRVREFFRSRNVLEVETPILSHSGSVDGHIDLFSAQFHPAGTPGPAPSETAWLGTSPEYHMKRLLASGYGDVFQIGKVFRNGELGRIHNPEFTMLEWYRVGWTMEQLIGETAALITGILGDRGVVRKKYADLFAETTGINPLTATMGDVEALFASRGIAAPPFATVTDALQFAMAAIVEPALDAGSVAVVSHYPAAQAVLAVLDPDDPRTALRFEAYCGGVELANGFEELGDGAETRRRLLEENAKRRSLGRGELPIDNRFLAALESGLPSCSGVALGLDRLIMLALGKKTLGEVVTFRWELS